MRTIPKGLLLAWSLVLSACANIPAVIREPPPGDLQLATANLDISAYQGRVVRWGGAILSVANDEQATWIEILQRTLGGSGRPVSDSPSQGRFVARFDGFLDPEIYRKNQDLTVYGVLDGEVERSVGKKRLRLPVVSAMERHLWADKRNRYSGYGAPPYYPYYHSYPYFYPYLYHGHHGFHFGHGLRHCF